MVNWVKVITHPLGFAGYALAAVFGLIARFGPSDHWPWLIPAAIGMAMVSLLGGIGLAFLQAHRVNRTRQRSPLPSTPEIRQQTGGDQSPAVANTHGDVKIHYKNKDR